ncbi:MAG TPA: bifunctional hydroxymethylpyrimidine kinase/phosphomethylpyrimidine kinase [Leptolyngbyaceae cyanobacterium M33_DOE_097]|uniref:D-glycero-beta-D-manno-heptose-7-phosphate kinase n=1 Tax=Oscillatoriales cyanobacterium SpSt-418 TaxID=2282169 RepID=A0A7C3PTX7_9CYAN|nr:bifunctional hydroxymethylpyrimidine kinase/phosphomethylpyrimidine kinase [Leptolyngbyaceae cyanobacterium M33_DOE_097]
MSPDSLFATQLQAASDRLFYLIEQFHQARVLVVGDLMLDEFLTGQVERASREAPVLVIRHETTRQVPGGGANAAQNLAKLGAQVKVVGLLGDDPQGKVLLQIFEQAQIDTHNILVDGDRPTVTKTRISGHARQSVTQQIVRVDRKSDALPPASLQQQLANCIQQQLTSVDAIVCSDYGDGVLLPTVIDAALQHPLSVVDSQRNIPRYVGATLYTPNVPEAELALGYPLTTPTGETDESLINRAGEDLLAMTQATAVLITRGEDGMSLFEASGKQHHIPAFNRTDVYDVTGAGDTVVAALTLALTQGATPWEASVLGNLAASIVVRQFGTSTTSAEEMAVALRSLLETFAID